METFVIRASALEFWSSNCHRDILFCISSSLYVSTETTSKAYQNPKICQQKKHLFLWRFLSSNI